MTILTHLYLWQPFQYWHKEITPVLHFIDISPRIRSKDRAYECMVAKIFWSDLEAFFIGKEIVCSNKKSFSMLFYSNGCVRITYHHLIILQNPHNVALSKIHCLISSISSSETGLSTSLPLLKPLLKPSSLPIREHFSLTEVSWKWCLTNLTCSSFSSFIPSLRFLVPSVAAVFIMPLATKNAVSTESTISRSPLNLSSPLTSAKLNRELSFRLLPFGFSSGRNSTLDLQIAALAWTLDISQSNTLTSCSSTVSSHPKD